MERKHLAWLALAGSAVVAVASIGVIGYQQKWFAAPPLAIVVTATGPGGAPLEKVAVRALDQPMGETGSDGVLEFTLYRAVGEQVSVSAELDRPGLEFKPWKTQFVVRKWDGSDPASLRYALEAKLEARAILAFLEVFDGIKPVPGATVSIAGKREGQTDRDGRFAVKLGRALSRSLAVSVQAKGFKVWNDQLALVGGESFLVDLSAGAGAPESAAAVEPSGEAAELGAEQGGGGVSRTVVAGYESLGRFVPVAQAEATIKGKKLGRTDAVGHALLRIASGRARVDLRRDGFLPDPASVELRGARSASAVVPLYPDTAPTYRVAVLPLQSGSAADPAVASALPELGEKLSDYLFSFGCFAPADPAAFTAALRKSKRSLERALDKGWDGTSAAALADVVVRGEVSLSHELVLSVEVVSLTGKRLGAFAEQERPAKVRQLAENSARRVVELFPFEGHVVRADGAGWTTSLGSSGERGLRRGQAVEVLRWSGALPPKLKTLARGKIRTFDANRSVIDATSSQALIAPGDKVVLLPRGGAAAAAFSSVLSLTLMAGAEGAASPFTDVNVYRDGIWVGTTGDDGMLEVPVEDGRSHELLFVRSGIQPHSETLKIKGRAQSRTVYVPNTFSHLLIDSEPSQARVVVDGRELGTTPLDTQVQMGFRHVQIIGGAGWRSFDQVLEISAIETSYSGARRIVLEKDVLAEAEAQIAQRDFDAAIALLSDVGTKHPDYSAAHNLLGGLYLDEKKDADSAIREFESVLARPENRELVNKRFAVTFLNLGRAYYAKGKEGYERAIQNLLTARDNKRFFPKERYDSSLHDTLYFLALASHRLYHAQPSDALLHETAKRWKDYFDFFPASLQDDAEVQQARQSAEQFYAEIRRKAGE